MSSLSLTFTFDLNTSLQTDDILYYRNIYGQIVKIGKCTSVSGRQVICEAEPGLVEPVNGDYIFFGKDNSINTSGVLGYYAEVDITNNSTDYAELFAVNSEIFISSN